MKYRKMLVGLFSVGVMALPVAAVSAATTMDNAGGFKGMGSPVHP